MKKSEKQPFTVQENKVSKLEKYLLDNYNFRYNEVLKETEIKPKRSEIEFIGLDERKLSDIRIELSKVGFNGFKGILDDLLKSSSFAPSFNPFEDYFKNLPKWQENETDHIAKLCSYLNVKEHGWFIRMFKKHLVRTVACAMRRLDFNKHCVVFQGKQNDGKTSFIRFLAPPKLKGYYKENPPLDHKDSVLALGQNLLINLDELHDLNKADANKVKTLFSQSDTKIRNHYAIKDTLQPRYASFFGTINEREFLNDVTGNVRWLIFEVLGVKHDNGGENGYSKNIDIDLVWSQAYHLLLSGFEYNLTKDEIQEVEKMNRIYQKTTPEIDLISEYFEPSSSKTPYSFALNATAIIQAIQTVTNNQIKLGHVQVGKALTFLGFEKESIRLQSQNNPTHRYIVTSRDLKILDFLSSQYSYLATS
ncbi:MAG: VapE domain-containing protein [Spirosomataceae bacterium]